MTQRGVARSTFECTVNGKIVLHEYEHIRMHTYRHRHTNTHVRLLVDNEAEQPQEQYVQSLPRASLEGTGRGVTAVDISGTSRDH